MRLLEVAAPRPARGAFVGSAPAAEFHYSERAGVLLRHDYVVRNGGVFGTLEQASRRNRWRKLVVTARTRSIESVLVEGAHVFLSMDDVRGDSVRTVVIARCNLNSKVVLRAAVPSFVNSGRLRVYAVVDPNTVLVHGEVRGAAFELWRVTLTKGTWLRADVGVER